MSMIGIGILLVVLVVLLLWLGAVYVLSAMATSALAKNRRIPNPWMAWVPVASSWLTGMIADQYEIAKNGKDRSLRKKLMGWTIAQLAVNFTVSVTEPFVSDKLGLLIVLVLIQFAAIVPVLVYEYIALYRIYQSCTPNHAVWMLVLSILSPTAWVIILFCVRNKTEGIEEYLTAEENSAEGEVL